MPTVLLLPDVAAPPRVSPDQARTEVLANDDGQAPWGAFHLATIMFHRVRQLRSGSRPRVEPEGHKPYRVALLEVQAGAIPWEVHDVAPAPTVI
jgi:DNA-directed RNA polymerase subunit K/omega